MKVSHKTIEFLIDMITGNGKFSEYKSGPELVRFFNNLGFHDMYGQGFPSRWYYVEHKLLQLNNQGRIDEVLKSYLSPINFVEKENQLNELIEKTNKYLEFDGFKIKLQNKTIEILPIKDNHNYHIEVNKVPKIDNEFIRENLDKCDRKIAEGDNSGAITNARTLLETILLYIYREIKGEDFNFNGDLNKLYKEVSNTLKFSKDKKIEQSIKQVLGGISTVINGIAGISNKLGDRHGKLNEQYKPGKSMAILVVNATKTLSEFLVSAYENQCKDVKNYKEF
jgi:hypothetical protein